MLRFWREVRQSGHPPISTRNWTSHFVADWWGRWPWFMKKNRVDIWMPVFIGDYLADTIGLTLSEHGGYFMAMMMYWKKGYALTDKELRAATGREYQSIKEFFHLADGLWHHGRIDSELAIAISKSKAAREKALLGVAAKKKKASDA